MKMKIITKSTILAIAALILSIINRYIGLGDDLVWITEMIDQICDVLVISGVISAGAHKVSSPAQAVESVPPTAEEPISSTIYQLGKNETSTTICAPVDACEEETDNDERSA